MQNVFYSKISILFIFSILIIFLLNFSTLPILQIINSFYDFSFYSFSLKLFNFFDYPIFFFGAFFFFLTSVFSLIFLSYLGFYGIFFLNFLSLFFFFVSLLYYIKPVFLFDYYYYIKLGK